MYDFIIILSIMSVNKPTFKLMSNVVIDSYKLGDVKVVIEQTDHPEKLLVKCSDEEYRSEFKIRKYEYQNYKRHMNQRIKDAFAEGDKKK